METVLKETLKDVKRMNFTFLRFDTANTRTVPFHAMQHAAVVKPIYSSVGTLIVEGSGLNSSGQFLSWRIPLDECSYSCTQTQFLSTAWSTLAMLWSLHRY